MGHTAAGKLLGKTDDAVWYEVAYLVGAVHGMNGVADGLRLPLDFTPDPTRIPLISLVDPATVDASVRTLFQEITGFFAMPGPPNFYLALASDPRYVADHWRYLRHLFSDGHLSRLHKSIIALASSMAARSAYGIDFHYREARRLGLGDDAMQELIFVTEQFHAVNKIATCLQLEPDMQAGLARRAQ